MSLPMRYSCNLTLSYFNCNFSIYSNFFCSQIKCWLLGIHKMLDIISMISSLNCQLSLDKLKFNQRGYKNLLNSGFGG